jgi:hypothetical protein
VAAARQLSSLNPISDHVLELGQLISITHVILRRTSEIHKTQVPAHVKEDEQENREVDDVVTETSKDTFNG